MNTGSNLALTTGQCATLSCLLELNAPKPGNVHRGADFEDATFADFAASAVAIAPAMDAAPEPMGRTVLNAIQATSRVTRTNTNLGIVLLLAPLSKVPREEPWADTIDKMLKQLTPEDAADVYKAIRHAQPGGMQPLDATDDSMDVFGTAPEDLLKAMAAGAPRDMIARQYVNAFQDVFEVVVPALMHEAETLPLSQRTIHAHLQVMSRFPDSLILRKCGRDLATEASMRASAVLDSGPPTSEDYRRSLANLDFWLRSDGHRRNPGTTADLITAGLFVLLRDGHCNPPFN